MPAHCPGRGIRRFKSFSFFWLTTGDYWDATCLFKLTWSFLGWWTVSLASVPSWRLSKASGYYKDFCSSWVIGSGFFQFFKKPKKLWVFLMCLDERHHQPDKGSSTLKQSFHSIQWGRIFKSSGEHPLSFRLTGPGNVFWSGLAEQTLFHASWTQVVSVLLDLKEKEWSSLCHPWLYFIPVQPFFFFCCPGLPPLWWMSPSSIQLGPKCEDAGTMETGLSSTAQTLGILRDNLV